MSIHQTAVSTQSFHTERCHDRLSFVEHQWTRKYAVIAGGLIVGEAADGNGSDDWSCVEQFDLSYVFVFFFLYKNFTLLYTLLYFTSLLQVVKVKITLGL